jgi:hypothetical protein
VKQIAEFARPADVADVDIAHRLRETRSGALRGILPLALPAAAIRPLPAARIAGGDAGLVRAIFCVQRASAPSPR